MSSLSSVTDDSFKQEVLASDVPVLVDFWATWCAPCKMLEPVLDQIAGEYDGRLRIVKVDIDTNVETARTYGITSAPTLNLYIGGEIVEQILGAKPKRKLLELIEPHLSEK